MYTLTNSHGCDSIISLNLTILQSNSTIDSVTACDSFTWIDGITYSSSNNTATHLLTNVNGCDSVVNLNLSINYNNSNTYIISACENFTWIDGITYNTSNNTATHILTNTAGCDSIITLDLSITSIDNSLTVNTNDLTANQAGASYQWIDCNNGNTIISGATNQTFNIPANGNYAVIITSNNCIDTSACQYVLATPIEAHLSNNFTIYPNPTEGNFSITTDESILPCTIKIYNALGELLDSHLLKKNQQRFILEGKAGIYFITLTSEKDKIKTYKIIKE
jgi:hypothetical protein